MIYDKIIKKEEIKKGWSEDIKYCVTVIDGTKYLLRITSDNKKTSAKALFEVLKEISGLGVPMCKAVEYGVCAEGNYTLYTWINGEDAERIIPTLSKEQQYEFGCRSGEILKRMHSMPAPGSQEDWHRRFNRKTDLKIKKYGECGYRFKGDSEVIGYLRNNRDVFKNRPQTFQHGDYHIGNMMIEDNSLVIIDFDRYDYGDPWEEFNRIVWCAQKAPVFAKGIIDGYFNKKPPTEFWKCLAFYICSNTLSSIYWAIDFGQQEIDVMLTQSQDVLRWYDDFKKIIPSWYT